MIQMPKSARRSVMITVVAFAVIGCVMAILLRRSVVCSLGGGGTAKVIRRPGATPLPDRTSQAVSTILRRW